MKKLGLLLAGLLLSVNAHAGIIALNTISADATIGGFNDNFTVIKNAFNGQVQGSGTTGSSTNILAASIGTLDIAAEANPATRDSELLGLGVDSTTTQATFVYTGLTPATSASLTSNVSAGTAYINGIRVVKAATSETYTASMDTYVDLSQTGVYTLSAVALGGTAPSVAANSARLAKVVTSGTAITSVTDLANRRLPGLSLPSNFRDLLLISRDTVATIIVSPGSAEINNAIITKTASTTLTLATAGDWAGGVSLRAVSTFGFVGIDVSGNLKMHTTAPAFTNYGVSLTDGTKRYATWSGTVYRIIGWFFMNSTGSGELNVWEVSNFRDGSVPNNVTHNDNTADTVNDTTFGSDLTGTTQNFYTTGRPIAIYSNCTSTAANWLDNGFATTISMDGTGIPNSDRFSVAGGTGVSCSLDSTNQTLLGQGTHQMIIRGKVNASDDKISYKVTRVEEL